MEGGPDAGMQDVPLTYTLGDKGELWEQVFGPLKYGSFDAGGEARGEE